MSPGKHLCGLKGLWLAEADNHIALILVNDYIMIDCYLRCEHFQGLTILFNNKHNTMMKIK